MMRPGTVGLLVSIWPTLHLHVTSTAPTVWCVCYTQPERKLKTGFLPVTGADSMDKLEEENISSAIFYVKN